MATAIETGSQPRTPSAALPLPLASLLGAVYVALGLAIVFYALPRLWADNVTPLLGDKIVDWVLWIPALCAVVVGLLWFGHKLAGESAPRGVHGGIFLMISAAIAIFFLWRALAMNVDGTPGMIVSGVFGLFLVFLALRFFNGKSGEAWMIGLEEQGWFSTALYKPSLGIRVRRLTILGILLIGGSGIYSLSTQGILPVNWVLDMPFAWQSLTVLPNAPTTVLVLLALLTGWVAWRAVNIPSFAEFLIATEAEMNKVSWTPRKRLAQDTVVVLTTTLLLALFLLVVDLFWGWLLSRQVVGVLPSRASTPEKTEAGQRARW